MPKRKNIPDLHITRDNYEGRDTNIALCNMTRDYFPDAENNPLVIRDSLSRTILDLLDECIDRNDYDTYAIAEVMALGAEQTLRDLNLRSFRVEGDPHA